MVFQNRVLVYANNRVLYHAILFASFVVAVLIKPYVETFVAKYVVNSILLMSLPWIITYVAALYILPELGFMAARSSMSGQQ